MAEVTDPYTFADGPGNRAYGTQVNSRFNALYNYLNAAPITAHIHRGANQSIPDNTATAIDFDTELLDWGGLWAIGSPSRITVPTGGAGLYLIGGWVEFAANATGIRVASVRASGSFVYGGAQIGNAGAGSATIVTLSPIPINVADAGYLELLATQTSGGALNALARFWAVKLGANQA